MNYYSCRKLKTLLYFEFAKSIKKLFGWQRNTMILSGFCFEIMHSDYVPSTIKCNHSKKKKLICKKKFRATIIFVQYFVTEYSIHNNLP